MELKRIVMQVVIGLTTIGALAAVAAQDKPIVQAPQPGVPEIAQMEGPFVRIAYNNEGFVTLGYRIVNESVGEEWVMLDIGATVRQGQPNYKMTREALSLDIPDGRTIPLATNSEFLKVDLRAMQNRANVMRDSINYFPPGATQACRIGFFADIESRARAFDEVELHWQRACLGRIYFQVPGGIKLGQHWLNVKFQNSLVRVPFRILTEEEEKLLQKNYRDIREQMQEAFSPKKP